MGLCSIALGGGVVFEYRTEEGHVNINCRLTSSVEVLLNGVCAPLVVCTEREMRGFCDGGESSATPSCFASLDHSVFLLKLLILYNVPSQVSSRSVINH